MRIFCSYQMMLKMGWGKQGLGRNQQGIVEPIKQTVDAGTLGLGKQEEYDNTVRLAIRSASLQ